MIISLPIRLGHITIVKVDLANRKVEMLVEVPVPKKEEFSPSTARLLHQTSQLAMKYLVREDFLPKGLYAVRPFAVPTK